MPKIPETTHDTPARPIPACPWCGAGTVMEIKGDGLGQLAMTCTRCGSSGPSVGVKGEFHSADEQARNLWASRRQQRQVAPDLLHRISMSVRLHSLTGQLMPDSTIGLAWSDLDLLLKSIAP